MARKQSTIEEESGADHSASSSVSSGPIRVRVKGPGTVTVDPVGNTGGRYKHPGEWFEIDASELADIAHAVETVEQAADTDRIAKEAAEAVAQEGRVDPEFMRQREVFRAQAKAQQEAAEIYRRMQAGLPDGRVDQKLTAAQRAKI